MTSDLEDRLRRALRTDAMRARLVHPDRPPFDSDDSVALDARPASVKRLPALIATVGIVLLVAGIVVIDEARTENTSSQDPAATAPNQQPATVPADDSAATSPHATTDPSLNAADTALTEPSNRLELTGDGLTIRASFYSEHPILVATRDRHRALTDDGESPIEFGCEADAVASITMTDADGTEVFLRGASETTDILVRGLRPGEQLQRVAYGSITGHALALLIVRSADTREVVVDADVVDSAAESGWSAFLIDTAGIHDEDTLQDIVAAPAGDDGALVITSHAVAGDAAC